MEYIKLFEKMILDEILDKMSKHGKDSLTDLENEYLMNYGDKNKALEIENKIKEKDKPKKEENIEEKYQELWDNLDDENIDEFIVKYKIMEEFKYKRWNEVPTPIKDRFKEFVKIEGYL